MTWYVVVGSAVGGAVRYLLGGWVQRKVGTTFPIQTLLINVSGSFLLGLLQQFALQTTLLSPEVRALLTIGFCGGYTTFSTFSYESVRMLEDGDWQRTSLYLASSVVLSLGAVILGILAAKQMITFRTR